ncbi:MAG: SRPBCC domain-containing protein [Phycisphaerae bacterium]
MTTRRADSIDDREVRVSVLIAAKPATVWRFLSEAERFAAWIGAYAGQAPLAGTKIEPRVGGAVRVEYPGGHLARGEITAIDPPRRVALTWGYESGTQGIPPGSTHIEITLEEAAGGTIVTLRHAGLPTPEARRGALGGWRHYATMLAKLAADAQYAEGATAAWSAYFAAWGEKDAAARERRLASCCEPAVRFRSSFACTDNLCELSEHIGNAQQHMPNMPLTLDGAPQQLHGWTRARWQVAAPNGQVVFRGENVAELSLAGRFTSVVSFPDAPSERGLSRRSSEA